MSVIALSQPQFEVASQALPIVSTAVSTVTSVEVPSLPRLVRKQAWLAVHFHQWPLFAALSGLSDVQRDLLDTHAVAVVEDDRQRRVVVCNERARKRGVRPGHALNTAIALCSEIKLLPRDLKKEHECLEVAAQWAQQYTPNVVVQAPNELLLEVRGSIRLFGGVQGLMHKVNKALQVQQWPAALALSATARSALWLARATVSSCIVLPRDLNAQLARLPLYCLHWPERVVWRLQRFGVIALGDLLRLPRADLARRIGVRYVRELDSALGRHVDINPLYRPPKRYEDYMALEFDVETTTLLEIFIESRLKKLQDYLRQHDLALSELSIELLSRQASKTPIRIGLAVPTADMAYIKVLLHEHLQRVSLTSPVTAVCIQVNRLLPARGVSLQLFKSLTSSGANLDSKERIGLLLGHLQARLQQQAVQQLQTHADYRPEMAQGMAVPQVEVMQSNVSIPSLPRRPTWLLQEPQLLCASSQLPVEIKLISGPERIEAGWWDQHNVARDYYVASRGNQYCWLFRQHGTQHDQQQGWYLHGLFA